MTPDDPGPFGVGDRIVHRVALQWLDHRFRTGTVVDTRYADPIPARGASGIKDVLVNWDFIEPEPGRWINPVQPDRSWVSSIRCELLVEDTTMLCVADRDGAELRTNDQIVYVPVGVSAHIDANVGRTGTIVGINPNALTYRGSRNNRWSSVAPRLKVVWDTHDAPRCLQTPSSWVLAEHCRIVGRACGPAPKAYTFAERFGVVESPLSSDTVAALRECVPPVAELIDAAREIADDVRTDGDGSYDRLKAALSAFPIEPDPVSPLRSDDV